MGHWKTKSKAALSSTGVSQKQKSIDLSWLVRALVLLPLLYNNKILMMYATAKWG
jgi:hypothetical protein